MTPVKIRRGLGFSLMEVTLALGISSVAMLSIVGLLGTAMDTSSTAGQDTALASMTALITGDMHAAPFDALGLAEPKTLLKSALTTLTPPLIDSVYYFTNEGTPVTGAGAATKPETVYQCVVRKTVDETFRSASGGPYNLVDVALHFTWPVPQGKAAASAKPPHEAIFHASIARY